MNKIILIILCAFSLTANAQDSTKRDTSFVLTGKIQDFNLLYRALVSPGDVTPNQISALVKWLQSIQAIVEDKKNKK